MKRSIVLLVLMALLLSSCLIINNYDLTVQVHKDGSYDVKYQGELNYMPAMEAVNDGEFNDDKKSELQEVIDDLKENEDYSSIKDLGKGRLSVVYEKSMAAGEDYYFLDSDFKFFSFEHSEDGNLLITGFMVESDTKESLQELRTDMQGKLEIILPKNMKVATHNANKTQKVDKKNKAYFWELDMNSEKPAIEIKL